MVAEAWWWFAACSGYTVAVALAVGTALRRTQPQPQSSAGAQPTSARSSEWAACAWHDVVRKARRLAFKRRSWSFLGQHLRAIKQRSD